MSHLSGFLINKHARALAAALTLGAAVLNLSAAPVGAEPKIDVNDPANMCTITRADGTVDYYQLGDKITVNGKTLSCSGPNWVLWRTGSTTGTTVGGGGGGVYAP